MSSFADADLKPALVTATERLGYLHMTPIQEQALPPILAGHDVVARAKTGSGKTAAFGLGLLQELEDGQRPGPPVALVLGPTRELVDQVAEALRQLAGGMPNTRIVTLCGGRPLRAQKNALKQGTHVVVGTPGRVADHLERGHLDLSQVRTLVLDEADRMLDMGFADAVLDLVRQCPAGRQSLLFSATFPEGMDAWHASILRDPVRLDVDTQVAAAQLQETWVRCTRDTRGVTVASILAHHDPPAALIFCETRLDCDDLQHFLADCGASVLALHGGLEQRERDDVLVQFANGSVRFLVATDVAARGLDIPALPLVVQAELPRDPAVYVHRIGRTARAGSTGHAVAVVASAAEHGRMEHIVLARGLTAELQEPPQVQALHFEPSAVQTLLLLAGRSHKLRKGDVVGALVKDAGLPPSAIGDIHLTARTCAVAIDRAHARRALRWLRRGRIKKQRIRATLLGG